MRILSLNAWGGRLHAPLLRFLAEADPDVLCLQEVTRSANAPAGWLDYREGEAILPQRADLFGEVCEALPRHDAFFCAAAQGPLFRGEEQVPSLWGLATFVRRTFAVIGQAQDFVHGGFLADGWGEHPRARNAHALRLFIPAEGFTVTVAQMHGLRDPAGKADTPARLAQAEKLVRLIERVRPAGEKLVVCGDFNLLPDSASFAALGRLGLTDLVTSCGHSDTRTSFYRKLGRFADYLLVTPGVEVRRFEVIAEPEVSDHRALLVEIG